MAFPVSPINGQQATVNGIIYTYNSTKTAWLRTTTAGATLSANSLVLTNSAVSISNTSGALIVAGGAGFGGNVFAAAINNTPIGNTNPSTGSFSTLTSGSISTSGVITSSGNIVAASSAPSTSTTSGALVVNGGVGINGNINNGGYILPGANVTYDLGTTLLQWRNAFASNVTVSRSLGVGTTAAGNVGEIRATNYITAFYSDRRLKSNIQVIDNALNRVNQLTGIFYTQNQLAEQYGYNDYSIQVGLFAQDLEKVLPPVVRPAPFDVSETGTSISGQNYLTVQYEKIIPLLVEAIKELSQQVEQLKGK